MFSLFRIESREEAEEKFISLKDKLPVFVEIAKEVRIIFRSASESQLHKLLQWLIFGTKLFVEMT